MITRNKANALLISLKQKYNCFLLTSVPEYMNNFSNGSKQVFLFFFFFAFSDSSRSELSPLVLSVSRALLVLYQVKFSSRSAVASAPNIITRHKQEGTCYFISSEGVLRHSTKQILPQAVKCWHWQKLSVGIPEPKWVFITEFSDLIFNEQLSE